jgi:hypothetical protein
LKKRNSKVTFFWVLVPCILGGRCQRFGKHTVSIFRAEVAMLGSGRIYIGLKEWKAGGMGKSERRNERKKFSG